MYTHRSRPHLPGPQNPGWQLRQSRQRLELIERLVEAWERGYRCGLSGVEMKRLDRLRGGD